MSGSTDRLGLAVTSSTGVIGVAFGVVGGERPMAETTIETDRRHAEEISPLIARLSSDAGIALTDLDLLVVDRGPGRFTGLRVGLATVKALAFALDLPVVGLTSLEVLAQAPQVLGHGRCHGAGQGAETRAAGDETVTAVIDARRSEVFQQTFKAGLPLTDPVVGLADELARMAAGLVVGDGLDRYPDPYDREAVHGRLTPLRGVVVAAATMLRLAVSGDLVPGAAIEPLYLRNPDVNPNVKTRPRA
jgi:tRNA threonylcarbamoyladenosine biosynthesis protein TsaB